MSPRNAENTVVPIPRATKIPNTIPACDERGSVLILEGAGRAQPSSPIPGIMRGSAVSSFLEKITKEI